MTVSSGARAGASIAHGVHGPDVDAHAAHGSLELVAELHLLVVLRADTPMDTPAPQPLLCGCGTGGPVCWTGTRSPSLPLVCVWGGGTCRVEKMSIPSNAGSQSSCSTRPPTGA